MTVMYSFCLWFPVRLGAIFVAITCMCESVGCLIAAVVGLHDGDGTSQQIDSWLTDNDLIVATDFFVAMRDDPASYLNGIITVLAIHICACALLLAGAFRCTLWLMYPFVGLDFLRLLTLSGVLVVLILIIKANTITLGMVIACSIIGGFTLLYMWYQWFCVVSLCQIIREVERMDQIQSAPVRYPSNISSKMALPIYPQPFMTKAGMGARSDGGGHNQFYGMPRPT